MASLFGLYPFLLKRCADGGYRGPQFEVPPSRVVKRANVEIIRPAHFYAGPRSALR